MLTSRQKIFILICCRGKSSRIFYWINYFSFSSNKILFDFSIFKQEWCTQIVCWGGRGNRGRSASESKFRFLIVLGAATIDRLVRLNKKVYLTFSNFSLNACRNRKNDYQKSFDKKKKMFPIEAVQWLTITFFFTFLNIFSLTPIKTMHLLRQNIWIWRDFVEHKNASTFK